MRLRVTFGLALATIAAIGAMGETVEYKTDADSKAHVTKGTLPSNFAEVSGALQPNCAYESFFYKAPKTNEASITINYFPKCGAKA